ncbi:uncharacterized protein PV09_02086 [Verruconis gallopava]|uniref:Uncharacterized protein n=1 Tax=Verruconis gallopava TaxID=253628 RepID=A0A0D2B7J9_9PEZI|nr:uncharacterized protein PV09_02086 [Verruconis gallopava]KIW07229.1 hypothetical protein PV09_02086 [Verruconis gallopava]
MATETTPSSSLSRYRPVVLALTGFAALYGAYVVYNNFKSSPPPATPHRSNAVHRPRRPQRLSRLRENQTAETDIDQTPETPNFNPAETYGRFAIVNGRGQTVHIELRPTALPTLQTLQEEHGLPEAQARATLNSLRHEFVVRFMIMQFQNRGARSTWEQEMLAATRWLQQLGFPHDEVRQGLAQMVETVEREAAERGLLPDDADTIAGTDVGVRFGRGQAGLYLKQLLYHIAENQARQDGYLHRGFQCDSCGTSPIRGIRWKCANCVDLDLCNDCHATCMHSRNHIFYEIKIPTYAMNNLHAVQEPSYPGRLDMSKIPPLPADICKSLVDKVDFEKSEIEGLYDQFTCLASCPRPGDVLLFAIDRLSFQRAISPISSTSPLRPNLIFDRMFALFDADHDGLISFEDFVLGVAFLRSKIGGKSRRKKIFDAYDLDGDGYVTRRDFLRIFKALFTIQEEVTLDLLAPNEAVNGLRDATTFASSSRVISAAFTQAPRSVPEPRAPLNKPANSFGDRRNQPDQAVVNEDAILDVSRAEIVGNAWESQAQFPFDHRIGEPLSLRDFVYLQPRDSHNQAPTHLAREQRVRFAYGGSSIADARRAAWAERTQRSTVYDSEDSYSQTQVTAEVDGYQIPNHSQDIGREIAYQVMEESLNELLDPLFKEREDFHYDAQAARPEIRRWQQEIEAYKDRVRKEKESAAAYRASCRRANAGAAAESATKNALKQSVSDENINGHQPRSDAEESRRELTTMADAVVSIEEQVQAQALSELLSSQGFEVREDLSGDEDPIGMHLDISTQPTDSGEQPMRMEIMVTNPPSSLAPVVEEERRFDPTMPQFMPNSERDILDSRPRDVTVDPLVPPDNQTNEASQRLKNEAEIIRQFEYMFLGWERDRTTGKVVNSATKASAKREARERQAKSQEPPSAERLAKLAEYQEYLSEAREHPGINFSEFDAFMTSTMGSDFRFIEGWVEVCYF